MQYIFLDNSGEKSIFLKKETEEYNYLFKVRRHKLNSFIFARNENNLEKLYKYKIVELDRKSASLELVDEVSKVIANRTNSELFIIWCVVDLKTIEKTLPALNEIGVSKIYFSYCDFSQKNIKIDLERINRILRTSSMQSGRSSVTKVEIIEDLEELLETKKDKNLISIDFSENILSNSVCENLNGFIVGAEGGFSETEREILKNKNIQSYRVNTDTILKSSTAIVSVAGKILL